MKTLFTHNNTYVYREGEKKLLPCPFCGEIPRLLIEVKDDGDRYPRPFWHAIIKCQQCLANQQSFVVSEQLPEFAQFTQSDRPYPIPTLTEVDKVINNWNRRM